MLCLFIPYLKRIWGVWDRASWPLSHTWRNPNWSPLHAGHVPRTVSSAVRSYANFVLVSSIYVSTRAMIACEKEALTSG